MGKEEGDRPAPPCGGPSRLEYPVQLSESEIHETSLDRGTVTGVVRGVGTGAQEEHRKKPDAYPGGTGRAGLSQSLQDSPEEGNQHKSVPTNENKGQWAKVIEHIFISIKKKWLERA